MRKFSLFILTVFASLVLHMPTYVFANLNFSAQSSSIVINQNDSRLKITNNTNISGWDQHSIIRAADKGNTWVASGQDFVDEANNHLIYNNSNAIVSMDTGNLENQLIELSDHGVYIGDGRIFIIEDLNPTSFLDLLNSWRLDSSHKTYLLDLYNNHNTILLDGISMMSASSIDLSGYTLENHGDLIFSNKTIISSSGYLSPHGSAYILGGDLILPAGVDLRFTTSGVLDGQGNRLIFQGDSKLTLDQFITLTLRNIKLVGVKTHGDGSASINILRPRRAQLALENMSLCLERDFTFSSGELYIHSDVNVSGTCQFIYTSTFYARIDRSSMWKFDKNTTFSYAPQSSNRNLVNMANITSMFFLDGATLKSTTTGLQLTKGTLLVDHKNYLLNTATSPSEAIAFGNGTAADDLNVEVLPGGSLELTSGILDYQNAS